MQSMKRFFFAIALAIGVFTTNARAAQLSYEQKVDELLALSSLIKSQYGPYEYKRRLLKVSIDELVARYVQAAKTTTNLEFYYLLNRFIAEFKDSHFGARLQTDHVSKLGFVTDLVDGKALIDEIDRTQLSNTDFPFQRGDEITAINGTPAQDIILALSRHIGMGFDLSAKRLATQLLGFRSASIVAPQYGKAAVTIRQANGYESTVTLDWKQVGEAVENIDAVQTSKLGDYLDLGTEDIFAGFPHTEKSFRCSGTTRFPIPADAVVLMKEPFVAYYHPSPKGFIGYLRIPHYAWRNEVTGANENALRLQQYEYAIDELARHTVGLIIDQDHNCGGSVSHLEQMVSLFADKPFVGLEFQLLATRNEYLTLKQSLDKDSRITVGGVDFMKVLELIRTSWLRGERMTPKTTFRANRLIQPNTIRYLKPTVVLIDEMSGSGGDAFPAMMQGIGRAKLLGTRTMGAGGHVVNFLPMNYSANTLRMTKSLFYHPNGTAIENNGATPDIAYTITREDFIGGYKGYQATYTKALLEMIR